MIALRKKISTADKQIVIDLPDELTGKDLEVLIIPVNDKNQNKKDRSWLLNGPTLSEQQLKIFDEIDQIFNQWNIQQF